MNNETLKRDLCARLMYGVKAEILDYKNDYVGNKIDTIVGVNQWSKCGKLWSVNTRGGAKPSFERIKPYLFPTSALTKPIQLANYNNGEPFVPAIELLKKCSMTGFVEDFIKRIEIGQRQIESFATGEILEYLRKWHINYRLSPDQFIEVTEENNPYK